MIEKRNVFIEKYEKKTLEKKMRFSGFNNNIRTALIVVWIISEQNHKNFQIYLKYIQACVFQKFSDISFPTGGSRGETILERNLKILGVQIWNR